MRLLTVFVLTAVATTVAQLLPSSIDLRPLALLLDIVPIAGVIVATVFTATRLRRVSISRIRLLVAVYGYFAGGLIGALGVAHIFAVILGSMTGQQEFVYTFRLYSLLLLGVLLIVTGLLAAFEAQRMARGHRAALRASLYIWTAILAINLPLVPIQGFAILFSALAAIELLLLGWTRRSFNVRPNGMQEYER